MPKFLHKTTGEVDERCAEAGTVVGDGRSEIENVQVVTLKGVTAAMRPATVWLIVHRCCDNVRHDWLSKSQREVFGDVVEMQLLESVQLALAVLILVGSRTFTVPETLDPPERFRV